MASDFEDSRKAYLEAVDKLTIGHVRIPMLSDDCRIVLRPWPGMRHVDKVRRARRRRAYANRYVRESLR